ncbi:hypothetical protein F8B77_17215 [Aliivibrio finisterrensis]|uniref:Uncharacterized protein n=2 Tax=Aliivibrio finisterrensis TaxID=511998 RepID=A0A6N6RNN5_9GAMM|nr:hypothetical protein F8B77_17215 [Aliivibrio finisterrensis]
MLNNYGTIKNNIYNYPRCSNPTPKILDGDINDWLVKIDFESVVFISELESKSYVNSYYATFNYNRYIESIFRWQRNQESHTSKENVDLLNDCILQLEEFATKLVGVNTMIYTEMKNKYTKCTFFNCDVPMNEFSNLQKYESL